MLSATILSAALAVAEIQAPPAAGFSFRYEDLQPIGSQGNGAVEQPGEGDAAMSPTKDSPWGEAVEQAACGKGA